MAILCKVTLGGVALYPELPIGRAPLLIREQQRMLSGQLRTVHRAAKYTYTLVLTRATEAERAAWLGAAILTASTTYVDELSVSRTVVVQEVRDDLSATEPVTPGGLNTSGAGYYDLSLTIEEV